MQVAACHARAATVVGLPSVKTVQGESVSIDVRGGAVYLNGIAKVTSTDLVADNGVIHVIDAVMLPPSVEFPGTIVDALKASPSFSTLVGAVVSADLATTLSGTNEGNGFTVFAPSNDAFTALGVDLSTLDQAALSNILLYHVASGEVPASTVVTLSAAPTLASQDVTISVSGSTVTLNGTARVVRTDLRGSNGIIHVIDKVLTP